MYWLKKDKTNNGLHLGPWTSLQVQKFGSGRAVAQVPHNQISRPLGTPRSCGLNQVPDPCTEPGRGSTRPLGPNPGV